MTGMDKVLSFLSGDSTGMDQYLDEVEVPVYYDSGEMIDDLYDDGDCYEG